MTREEAIRLIGWLKSTTNREDDLEAIDMAIEALSVANLKEEFESADAVQGEWIDRSNGGRIKYPWWESCECNQCGEYGSGAYNYCPNCGARMKGGAE